MFKDENIIESLIMLLPVTSFVTMLFYQNTNIDKVVLMINFLIMLLIVIIRFQYFQRAVPMFIMLNVFSLMGTMILHSGIGAVLNLSCVLMAILVFNNISVNKKVLIRLHFLMTIGLFFYTFTVDKTYAYAGDIYDIVGNRININTWGMLCVAALLHMEIFFSLVREKKKKLLFIEMVFILILGYNIYLSESRASLLVVAVFFMGKLFLTQGLSDSVYRKMAVIILISSLLFPIIYVGLYHVLEDNVMILGKGLFTGRQIIWNSAFQQIREFPIWGSGNDFLLSTVHDSFTQSTHNMLIGVLKMFGIIPTITLIFFMVNKMSDVGMVRRNKITQIAFLASLIYAFFESYMMDSHIYMFFMLFLLSNVKLEEENSVHDT